MNMTNKLILPVESRMQGDLHVRFGGRLWETYHRKVARRPLPSLHLYIFINHIAKVVILFKIVIITTFIYNLLRNSISYYEY